MTSPKTSAKSRSGSAAGTRKPRLKKRTLKDLDTKGGEKLRGGGKRKATRDCSMDCITSPCVTQLCDVIIGGY